VVPRTNSGRKVKGLKSDAGKRQVALPPHLLPLVKAHLAEHAALRYHHAAADRDRVIADALSGLVSADVVASTGRAARSTGLSLARPESVDPTSLHPPHQDWR
jgi:hypothetical protein